MKVRQELTRHADKSLSPFKGSLQACASTWELAGVNTQALLNRQTSKIPSTTPRVGKVNDESRKYSSRPEAGDAQDFTLAENSASSFILQVSVLGCSPFRLI